MSVAAPERLDGWCPECRETVVIDQSGRCLWCETPTQAEIVNELRHASGQTVRWTETPEARRARYAKLGDRLRKIPEPVLQAARRMYDQGATMAQVAEAIHARGLSRHEKPERVEEALRRAFRHRGWPTRTTSESLAGRLCRAEITCAHVDAAGERCGQNPQAGKTACWLHDPDRRDEVTAHMDEMRQRAWWAKELLPMEPFVAWLTRRRDELALPPEQRRFRDRDEGMARLARSTGVAASTLGKWMTFRSSKGTPKHTITRSKVLEVLANDGTATLEDLYGDVVTALQGQRDGGTE